jgi:hypothetical protein
MRVVRVQDSVSRAMAAVRPESDPSLYAVAVGQLVGLMASGELAPAWARALVIGYAMGRDTRPEAISELWHLVTAPPAPVRRRKRLTL